MVKKNITKASVNRKTGQRSIALSKKLMKKSEPNLKFNEDVFIEWKILRQKKKGN